MPAVLFMRDRPLRRLGLGEGLAIKFLARKHRKQLRFLYLDMSNSPCADAPGGGGGLAACKKELEQVRKEWEWAPPATRQRQPGQKPKDGHGQTIVAREFDADPPHVVLPNGAGSGGAFVLAELNKQLKQRLLLAVPELTSRTVEQLCPHELQQRASKQAVWCVLLLGSLGADTAAAPRVHPAGPGAQTQTLKGAAVLLHNLAVVRRAAAVLGAAGSDGREGQTVLSDGKPAKFAWVDTDKQRDFTAALLQAHREQIGARKKATKPKAPKKPANGQPGGEAAGAEADDAVAASPLPALVVLVGKHFAVFPDADFGDRLEAATLQRWVGRLPADKHRLSRLALKGSDGKPRVYGAGRSWLVDEDALPWWRRLAVAANLDGLIEAVNEYLHEVEGGQIFLLLALIYMGYSAVVAPAVKDAPNVGENGKRRRRLEDPGHGEEAATDDDNDDDDDDDEDDGSGGDEGSAGARSENAQSDSDDDDDDRDGDDSNGQSKREKVGPLRAELDMLAATSNELRNVLSQTRADTDAGSDCISVGGGAVPRDAFGIAQPTIRMDTRASDHGSGSSVQQLGPANAVELLGPSRYKRYSVSLVLLPPRPGSERWATTLQKRAGKVMMALAAKRSSSIRFSFVDCNEESSRGSVRRFQKRWDEFSRDCRARCPDTAANAGLIRREGEQFAGEPPPAELFLWRQGGTCCTLYGPPLTAATLSADPDAWGVSGVAEWIQTVQLDMDSELVWHTVPPFFSSGAPALEPASDEEEEDEEDSDDDGPNPEDD
eukprot:SAG22_NODE_744_length_7501_cov_2.644826_5_plen_774_part_00